MSSTTWPWLLLNGLPSSRIICADAGDDHEQHRLGRHPAEGAGRVEEVLLAGPGEHDTGDERHAAEPHRRAEHVQQADADDRATAAARRPGSGATATSAPPGIAHAHIALAGSMIRSGRIATQPEPSTKPSRSSAPRPGQPSSLRSSQSLGFIAAPNEESWYLAE